MTDFLLLHLRILCLILFPQLNTTSNYRFLRSLALDRIPDDIIQNIIRHGVLFAEVQLGAVLGAICRFLVHLRDYLPGWQNGFVRPAITRPVGEYINGGRDSIVLAHRQQSEDQFHGAEDGVRAVEPVVYAALLYPRTD